MVDSLVCVDVKNLDDKLDSAIACQKVEPSTDNNKVNESTNFLQKYQLNDPVWVIEFIH